MRATGFDTPSGIEIAITRDGLFDDAVLERARALGWAPCRAPAAPRALADA